MREREKKKKMIHIILKKTQGQNRRGESVCYYTVYTECEANKRKKNRKLREGRAKRHIIIISSYYLISMATQSLHSLHPLSSSSSSPSSVTTAKATATHYCYYHYSLPTKPRGPAPAEVSCCCCSCRLPKPKLKGIVPTTSLFNLPVLLFTGFASDSLLELELDTQTLLVTLSVLAAISLSLFLGLKVCVYIATSRYMYVALFHNISVGF